VPSLVLRGMYNGPEPACREALTLLIETLADPEKQIDIWREGSYRDLNGYLLSYPTELPSVPLSTRVEVSSRIIADDLTAENWRQIVRLFLSTPVESNVLGMEPYGRAINAIAPTDSAFWHRRASFDLFTYAFWMFERDRAPTETYLAEFDRLVTPLSNGHSYQNYPNRRLENWRAMYFGDNFERLLEVKQRYDPEALFRFEQAITAPSEQVTAR
jgi:Berberine and berberine like